MIEALHGLVKEERGVFRLALVNVEASSFDRALCLRELIFEVPLCLLKGLFRREGLGLGEGVAAL